MIDPGIWTDDGFLALGFKERLLFIGLISHADDDGRGSAEPRSIRAKVFPGDELSDEEILEMAEVLCRRMRVTVYEVGGVRYYQLDRWRSHQYIKDRKPSTMPAPTSGGDGADVGPTSARERPGSGPTSARDLRPMNEGMKEGKERRADAGPAEDRPSSRSWTVAWYREYTKRTAQALEPSTEAYADAAKAWKRAKPDALLASVVAYFDGAFWFTKPKRGTRPEWSFRNYLAHLEEVLAATGKPPPKEAPRWDVRRCPNGHLYVKGEPCKECGWKEEASADDDF